MFTRLGEFFSIHVHCSYDLNSHNLSLVTDLSQQINLALTCGVPFPFSPCGIVIVVSFVNAQLQCEINHTPFGTLLFALP